MYYIIKVLISAILIVGISELSKRSSLIGAILASIPLYHVCWLYLDICWLHLHKGTKSDTRLKDYLI